ncbi:MAG: hypothetical protein L6Q93_16115 [Phycisphaerae bacterium]|nr:hypothetical protein [Phycisphaerae bacterium]
MRRRGRFPLITRSRRIVTPRVLLSRPVSTTRKAWRSFCAATPRAPRRRSATRCDPTCAAAHGHLGLVLQEKGRFYEAAIEWTLAKRLAPAAIEPYVNLMRMYTQIGWTKEAQREGEHALTLDPAHPDVLGQLALLSLRSGVGDARLDAWLETLAREDDGAWSAWAQRQRLARRPETQE